MSFILITILSVAFVVLVIHKLAAASKANLYWRSLLACALCAIAIDLALPILAIYMPNYQFIIIILVTLIAAYYIAGYNIYLDKLDEAKKCRRFFPPEEQAATINTAPKPLLPQLAVPENLQTFDFSGLASAMPLLAFVQETAELPKSPKVPADILSDSTAAANLAENEPAMQEKAEINAEAPSHELEAADNTEPADYTEAEEFSKEKFADSTLAELEAGTAVPSAAAPADQKAEVPLETGLADEPSAEPNKAEGEPLGTTMAESEENSSENAIIADKLTTLTKLNDILDYAYELRSSNDLPNALKAYKQALGFFPTNDYMPFVIIEIGNIYKATGEYGKAITVYNKALDLPVLRTDEVMKKEFINNIMYLRLLESALEEHNSQNLEYAAIPQDILQIVEDKFQEWREQNL